MYNPLNLKDGDILKANHLEHIEQGLLDASEKADNNESDIVTLKADKADKSVVSNLSNPNLLINGDFRVNQRGFTSGSYNTTSITYTVDRWRVPKNSKFNITIEEDGITLENTGSDYIVFSQNLEHNVKSDNGLTASCKISYVSGEVSLCIHGSQFYNKNITEVGIITITVGSEYYCNQVYLYLPSNAKVKVNWIKLEQGSIATPFVPRTYAEELAMSMRYCEPICISVAVVNNYTTNIPYRVPKRVPPTITMSEIKYGHSSSSMNIIDAFNENLKLVQTTSHDFGIKQQIESGIVWANLIGFADAEIY